jgi:hypothetical protein
MRERFGSLITLIFTEANALEAVTSFFKISLSSSISDDGGRKGRKQQYMSIILTFLNKSLKCVHLG